MARKDPNMTLERFVKNSRVPIEHHFHNHQWCNASWCPFKEWDDKELQTILAEQDKIENKRNPISVDEDYHNDDNINDNNNNDDDDDLEGLSLVDTIHDIEIWNRRR